MSFKKLVVDVSKYQGMINFKKMKEAGNVFGVIIRCAYRGYGNGAIVTDPYFFQNVQGCIDNGIPYGVYFFSQAITEAEAVAEAEHCLKLVKDQTEQPLFPIYIDSEWANVQHTGRADVLTKGKRTSVVKAFCDRIEKDKYFAGIYASTSWFNNQLNDAELVNYSHWVAHYADACGYKGSHHMWQYSSGGAVKGITSRADVNWCYLDFPTIIKANELNGYKKEVEKPKLKTLETNKFLSEYGFEKFEALARVLNVQLEVTKEVRYKVKTQPLSDGDIKQFQTLANALIEEVTIKEV